MESVIVLTRNFLSLYSYRKILLPFAVRYLEGEIVMAPASTQSRSVFTSLGEATTMRSNSTLRMKGVLSDQLRPNDGPNCALRNELMGPTSSMELRWPRSLEGTRQIAQHHRSAQRHLRG
jgi:hypothetical protein